MATTCGTRNGDSPRIVGLTLGCVSGLRSESVRVVQISCYLDPLRRRPEELLTVWPSLMDVAVAASDAGVEVTVLQAAARDATLSRGSVRIEFVAQRPAGLVRASLGVWATPLPRELAGRAAALPADLMHLHSLAFPLHARFLQRAVDGVPLLIQDHADRPPPRWRVPLHRRGLDGVSGVAFTARSQAEPFVRTGVLPADIPVFEILESSSRFTPGDQGAARARTGLHGEPCLLWLGNLDSNKDPLTVLDALSRAVPTLPDAQLWCCYRSAPLRHSVARRVASDDGLRGRVHLLGTRSHDDVQWLLRAADFLVQGSHSEGSGYAVIEALACGTTPLVTDIPSLRRITRGGRAGALSPPGDPESMARAIVDWAARDRGYLRADAREHFERYLSFEAVGRELRAAYEALVLPS